ncbi:MAG TPA: hypothetical protein VH542_00435 [Steroidobacteraceae bacterium]
MRRRFLHKTAGRSFASFLLLAFVVRSLIPVGFMPAPDRPFALEICPDGLPARSGLAASADVLAHVHPAAHQHLHEQPGAGAQHTGHVHVTQAGEHSAPRHQHSTHTVWTHCQFGGLASAPVPLQVAAPAPSPEASILALFDTDARFVSTTRFRIAQPRAPPVLVV